MTQEEFKEKYFTNNFYWVNFDNHINIQAIALKVGCLLHTGKAEMIDWHEGLNNLGFRTRNGTTWIQKEEFLLGSEDATDYQEMARDYRKLLHELKEPTHD